MKPSRSAADDVDRLGLLAEPVRRRLYEFVAAQVDPVDRDRAAAAVGTGRPLAAFHLDRLAKGGLLDIEYHRRTGRRGPGAGRPAKFYRRAVDRQVDVSLPPRRYGLAATILAEGLDRAHQPKAMRAVQDAARDLGKRLATQIPGRRRGRAALLEVLAANGYEPMEEGGGAIGLRNCPFHALVAEHRELTCGLNLTLLDSLVSTMGGTKLVARAQPRAGRCCVALVPVGSD
ncbi:MAG: helix-turn-helix transcriptional regulator [Candidatus Limnocylindria bacterium]